MNLQEWLFGILQFSILLPAAVFCYLPMKNQIKYTRLRIVLLCAGVLVPYAATASWLALYLDNEDSFLFQIRRAESFEDCFGGR